MRINVNGLISKRLFFASVGAICGQQHLSASTEQNSPQDESAVADLRRKS
jgi:hypothetical protein